MVYAQSYVATLEIYARDQSAKATVIVESLNSGLLSTVADVVSPPTYVLSKRILIYARNCFSPWK